MNKSNIYLLYAPIFILLLICQSCNRHHSTQISVDNDIEETTPTDSFKPWNPEQIIPSYGKVDGGNIVLITLPNSYEHKATSFRVFFGNLQESEIGNEATDVLYNNENKWHVECRVPASYNGRKQIVDVTLVPDYVPVDTTIWPPNGSVSLIKAYTYINPTPQVDYLHRDSYYLGNLSELSCIDYDDDEKMDMVGLQSENNKLVFIKFINNILVVDNVLNLPPYLHSYYDKNRDKYERLMVADINEDSLFDILLIRQFGFLLMINDINNPGKFNITEYSNKGRGKCGDLIDLNDDGLLDLIVSSNSELWIYYFDITSGIFPNRPSRKIKEISSIREFKAGDVNNDGKVDIVLLDKDKITILVNKNDDFVKNQVIRLSPIASNTRICKLKLCDLTNDRNKDIVFSTADIDGINHTYPAGIIGIAISNRDGIFKEPIYIQFKGVGWGLTGVTDFLDCDINEDGNLDLVVSIPGVNSIYTLAGNGKGDFSNEMNYGVGEEPRRIVCCDINNDRTKDLIVLEGNGDQNNSLSLLMGLESPIYYNDRKYVRFSSGIDIVFDEGFQQVYTSDLDYDGLNDLITTGPRGNSFSIKLNDGEGNFIDSNTYYAQGIRINSIIPIQATLKNDSYVDIAVVSAGNSNGHICVYDNDGNANLHNIFDVNVNGNPTIARIGDINNDGFTDIVALKDTSNFIIKLIGDGSGNFINEEYKDITFSCSDILLSDLDNDFDLDAALLSKSNKESYFLITSNTDSLKLANIIDPLVFSNTPDFISCEDFDNDKVVDIAIGSNETTDFNIMLGDGFFNYKTFTIFNYNSPISSFIVRDLDFDYYQDFILVHSNRASGIDIAQNKIDSIEKINNKIIQVNNYKAGQLNESGLLWSDINNDLLPDIMVPSYIEKKLTILINTSKEN